MKNCLKVMGVLILNILIAVSLSGCSGSGGSSATVTTGGDTGGTTGGTGGSGITWTKENVITGSSVGRNPQIALDSNNKPHVVSLDVATGAQVYQYSEKTTASWVTTNVKSAKPNCFSNVGEISGIVMDSLDSPHISLEKADEAIMYATLSGTTFSTSDISTNMCTAPALLVDPSFAFVGHNAIAINEADNTVWIVAQLSNHIGSQKINFTLRYWKTGDTSTTEIDRPTGLFDGLVGRSPSVVVDSLGNAHVSYQHVTGSGSQDLIKYAKWNGTLFVTELVVNIGIANGGWGTSLVVDSNNEPHIIYYQGGEGYKHAHFNGTSWVLEVVTSDTASAGGAWMDVAIDSSDNLYVVYVNSSGTIKFTKKTGSTWSTGESISTDGRHPAIAVESTGVIHAIWRDTTNDKLEYAKGTP